MNSPFFKAVAIAALAIAAAATADTASAQVTSTRDYGPYGGSSFTRTVHRGRVTVVRHQQYGPLGHGCSSVTKTRHTWHGPVRSSVRSCR